MVIKWIKAIITKPFTIIKGWYYYLIDKQDDIIDRRLELCEHCDNNIETSIGDTCSQCGCNIHAKARVKDEHCDLCKW